MPATIDLQAIFVDELPVIWSPVQEELTDEERRLEIEEQATASLLRNADVPEAVLRLLTGETEIERVLEPPEGFDPERQGEWDETLVTFAFKRPLRLESKEQDEESLTLTYRLEGAGHWVIEIRPESVVIERV